MWARVQTSQATPSPPRRARRAHARALTWDRAGGLGGVGHRWRDAGHADADAGDAAGADAVEGALDTVVARKAVARVAEFRGYARVGVGAAGDVMREREAWGACGRGVGGLREKQGAMRERQALRV